MTPRQLAAEGKAVVGAYPSPNFKTVEIHTLDGNGVHEIHSMTETDYEKTKETENVPSPS